MRKPHILANKKSPSLTGFCIGAASNSAARRVHQGAQAGFIDDANVALLDLQQPFVLDKFQAAGEGKVARVRQDDLLAPLGALLRIDTDVDEVVAP